jgi:hypothetical protein
MGAVLQYINQSGVNKERVWEVSKDRKFTALIKCFVQCSGEQTIRTIEKPSTRPATFHECYKFVQKLKQEHGSNLKQLIVWDMDALESNNPTWYRKKSM